jgi:phosphonate transport system ATP-binding protein
MRLIMEVCAERGLPAIINIHDVPLALSFVSRIVGLKQGEKVYDGPPSGLTPEVLSAIYGEEDWTGVSADAEPDETGPSALVAGAAA